MSAAEGLRGYVAEMREVADAIEAEAWAANLSDAIADWLREMRDEWDELERRAEELER